MPKQIEEQVAERTPELNTKLTNQQTEMDQIKNSIGLSHAMLKPPQEELKNPLQTLKALLDSALATNCMKRALLQNQQHFKTYFEFDFFPLLLSLILLQCANGCGLLSKFVIN